MKYKSGRHQYVILLSIYIVVILKIMLYIGVSDIHAKY